MSQPRDEARDAAVIDALYDPRARSSAEGGETAELAGYDRVRTLFRELPADEPPSALTAKLVAAAAQARKAERGGIVAWLRDLLAPLAHSPAFAAAASLVLVVGVAGILYMKGKAEVAQPQATAPEAARTPAPGAGKLEAAPAPAAAPTVTAMSEPLPAEERKGAAAPRKPALADDGAAKGRTNRARAVGKDSGLVGGFDDAVAQAEAGDSNRPPPDDEDKATEQAKELDQIASAARPQPDRAGPASAPPAPTVGAAGRASDEAARDEKAAVVTDGKQVERLAKLHAEAVAGAAKGNCDLARRAAQAIRSIDADYFARKVAPDRRLTACLAPAK